MAARMGRAGCLHYGMGQVRELGWRGVLGELGWRRRRPGPQVMGGRGPAAKTGKAWLG